MKYRVVMLGEGGVGKSSLTIQLVHNYFTTEYNPTIESAFKTQATIDDECCMMEILDTAGQEEYSVMRDQHIMQGDGFGLVYSITSRLSFEQLPNLYTAILRVKDADEQPIVIFGNKCDLEKGIIHQFNSYCKERDVSANEGRQYAKSINAPFIESSAKQRLNVEEGFFELVRQIRKYNQKAQKERPPSPTRKRGKSKIFQNCIVL